MCKNKLSEKFPPFPPSDLPSLVSLVFIDKQNVTPRLKNRIRIRKISYNTLRVFIILV